MTDSLDPIACKFTAQIEKHDDRYVVEVPPAELEHGPLTSGEPCQISIHTVDGQHQPATDDRESETPVVPGERRTVEIEDTGEQGDGITRVEQGYVLIVADGTPGDEVTVELENVFPTYAFASIVEEPTGSAETTI